MALTLTKPAKGVPNWGSIIDDDLQKIMDYAKANDAQLSDRVQGKWRLYTSFAELGITVTENTTMDDIVSKMPNGSSLLAFVGYNQLLLAVPINSGGTLAIRKIEPNRCSMTFIPGNSTTVWVGRFYGSEGFAGWTHIPMEHNMCPSLDNTYDNGRAGNRWKTFYGATSAISTSDERIKDAIQSISIDMMRNFIMALNPVMYEFTDTGKPEAERRTHWGFLGQEVEKALYENGLNTLDFAGLIISPDYEEYDTGKTDENGEPIKAKRIIGEKYGLRYEEFISMAFAMLQDHERRIEARDEKIAALETRLAALEAK